MKKTSVLLALALALGAAGAQAEINALDNVPAATLLLPHFEVDLANANGVRTVMTVGNSGSSEQAAHFTIWSDQGVPVLNFDVRLAARDVVEFDLRQLLVDGFIPQSTPGSVPGCAGFLPPALLSFTTLNHVRNALTGQASSVLGGMCAGANHGDSIARGFVTVDAVSSCSLLSPGDAGYFISGGLGIATNNNVLWGEQSTSNPGAGTAYGDALVHIEASASAAETDGPDTLVSTMPDVFLPDYTFYRRFSLDVSAQPGDNREALPQRYMGSYSLEGLIGGTQALVWRDPGRRAPFACGAPPAGLSTRQVLIFDATEELAITRDPIPVPLATQKVDLGNPAEAEVAFASGMVQYALSLTNDSSVLAGRNQAHVAHVLSSRDATAQNGALSLQPITERDFLQDLFFPQCSDGIDNDSDGQVDYPSDSDCLSADSNTENPECQDGLDNDGDMAIDYPADPGCAAVFDQVETDGPNHCSDGIDNDGDGLIDFPQDNGCSNPFEPTEYFGQCDDGVDNDSDGRIDYPLDLGCTSPQDGSEVNPECNDGIDNDGDGRTDFPNDPGCQTAEFNDESPACDDDADNDMDGSIDFPADLSCAAAYATSEVTACSDGIDNDGDMLIDYPNDPGCRAPSDNQEQDDPECADGIDNDGDGNTDYPNSPGCTSPDDIDEAPDCSDQDLGDPMNPVAIDNDLDGLANFASDPGCASALDLNELAGSTTRECSDGIDNDNDGFTDFGSDAQCANAWDDAEFASGQQVMEPEVPIPALSWLGLGTLAGLFALIGLFLARREAMSR